MKKNKLFLVLSVVTILVIGLSTAAFAATDYKTPAEIVAGLTGKTVDEATAERQAGTTYGAQAQAADKLDEFQTERLALCGENLDQAVLNGKLTQAEADKLLEEMNLRMEACDGTGTGLGQGERNGTGTGLCDGTGAGKNSERGTGRGMGMGRGAGNGNGTGLGCGSCTDQDLT
ncbi:MAG: hypothetical protein WCG21_07175 [Eubacteriales bacterium]